MTTSAYGDAATVALEACLRPMPRICGLVCYYPSKIPVTSTGPPPSLDVLVHVVGQQRSTEPYHSYHYADDTAGFAEANVPAYSKSSAKLAWSRTLALVKKGLGIESSLESIWEEHLACKCHGNSSLSRSWTHRKCSRIRVQGYNP